MHVDYQFQQAGYRAWQRLHEEGKLTAIQDRFWGQKPAEELYELASDPDEVHDLTASPAHQAVLRRMRSALRQHLLAIRDNGFIPEGSPLEGWTATRDASAYPLEKILDFLDVVTQRDPVNLPTLIQHMSEQNEVFRYWSAAGCLMLAPKSAPAQDNLLKLLTDPSPHVQIIAAEALCRLGQSRRALPILTQHLLNDPNPRVRLQAANSLDHLGPLALPALEALNLAAKDEDDYVKRSARYTAAILTAPVIIPGNPPQK
jgi:hypothetical protein